VPHAPQGLTRGIVPSPDWGQWGFTGVPHVMKNSAPWDRQSHNVGIACVGARVRPCKRPGSLWAEAPAPVPGTGVLDAVSVLQLSLRVKRKEGSLVQGLEFDTWYYYLHTFKQPTLMI
jgi:hypothetical protein